MGLSVRPQGKLRSVMQKLQNEINKEEKSKPVKKAEK